MLITFTGIEQEEVLSSRSLKGQTFPSVALFFIFEMEQRISKAKTCRVPAEAIFDGWRENKGSPPGGVVRQKCNNLFQPGNSKQQARFKDGGILCRWPEDRAMPADDKAKRKKRPASSTLLRN